MEELHEYYKKRLETLKRMKTHSMDAKMLAPTMMEERNLQLEVERYKARIEEVELMIVKTAPDETTK